jgi:hypothetical protein
MAVPKQTKNLTLDLSNIPTTSQNKAKEDVGEFVRNEILRFVSSGKSPVAGRGAFDRLNKEYADAKKGGNRSPNLELEGDLLDSLKYEVTSTGIEVGIFDSDEAPKADGHNNFSGLSKLPTRRFIPDASESFQGRIMTGVSQILDRYRENFDPFATDELPSALVIASTVIEPDTIDLNDILSGLGGGLFE